MRHYTAQGTATFIFLGLLELGVAAAMDSGCDRDELVMLQATHWTRLAEKSHIRTSMPVSEERAQTPEQAGSSPQPKIPDLSHVASTTSHMLMLGCALLFGGLWILALCFGTEHYRLPCKEQAYVVKGKAEESADKVNHVPTYVQAALDNARERTAQQHAGSLAAGSEFVAKATTMKSEGMPPGIGLCYCSSGLAKLVNPPPKNFSRKGPLAESSALTSSIKGSMFTPVEDGRWLREKLVPFIVPPPPLSSVSDGHPIFSGAWKCVRVEGDLDELLVDYGIGYMMRKLAKSYGYGAGYVRRICEHNGSRISYCEIGVEGFDNKVEFDVPCKDAQLADHLQTTQWDEVQPHVLIVQATDMLKAKPCTWSTSWHYLVDENTLHIKSRSAANHVGLWVYEREA